ncbi:MAG: HAD family hydrolase [Oscillatoriales cyanobacterium RU_3_3]|nr:HAD family hydrolase [Oscillatoriales cyanobacterium RU_3_3]NJR20752.1 HAD family hydrolase [Richelia sp. CSU_2_1]
MKPQAIICDRDGTLIEDCHFLSCPEQIQWIPGVLETLKLLNQLNVKVLVVTNQSGVARGYFDEIAVEAVNTQLRRDVEGVSGAIADFYYCPHHPNGQAIGYSYACDCRKPSPGMFLQAIRDHKLNPAQCWTIGDRLRDLEPGLQLGMTAFLVETGSGVQALQDLSQRPYARQVTVISSFAEIFSLIQSDTVIAL